METPCLKRRKTAYDWWRGYLENASTNHGAKKAKPTQFRIIIDVTQLK